MTSLSSTALVLTDEGKLDLTVVEVAEPGPFEVRVRLRASGVCHSDLHVAQGDWGSKTPMVLGHEGAGVIEAVGLGVPESRVGEHVAISWFAPCLRCKYCVTGREWACSNTTANDAVMADGTTRLSANGQSVHAFLNVGSFAEYAVVPESGAILVPEELPFEVAALIGCAATTGIGAALHTGKVRPGNSAVVIGSGGVGLSVLMGLTLAGAHPIVAVDVSEAKLDAARRLGATHTIDASDGDVVERVQAILGGGAAFAFEAAGRADTAEQCVALVETGGTVVLVGMPPSDSAQFSLNLLEVTNLGKTIIGCSYGSATPSTDFPMLAQLHLAGRLPLDTLVGQRITLGQVPQAFEEMSAGRGLRAVVIYD